MNGKLYNGDNREIIPKLENVNLVITSPPYNVGIKYDSHDDLMHPEEYYEFIRDVFSKVYYILPDDGRLAINIPIQVNYKKSGGSLIFLSAKIWNILEKIGFNYIATIDLDETSPHMSKRTAWGSWLSPSAPYVYNPKECVIICYKNVWKRINKGTSYFNKDNKKEFMNYVTGMWDYRAETKKLTEANFSLDIPLPAIKLLSWKEDTILDPFMGSGTTGLACEMLDRKWIGIEKSEKYYNVALKRIKEYVKIQRGRKEFF